MNSRYSYSYYLSPWILLHIWYSKLLIPKEVMDLSAIFFPSFLAEEYFNEEIKMLKTLF